VAMAILMACDEARCLSGAELQVGRDPATS
jgi:hypothetical protein